jgi:hypothetical protein
LGTAVGMLSPVDEPAWHDVHVLVVLTVISTVAGVVGAVAAIRQLSHIEGAATLHRAPAAVPASDGEREAKAAASHRDAEEALVSVFILATVPAGIIIAVMFFAWLLTKMTGVDRGGGWAAVIYALPLLAGVVGALVVVGMYAASYAVRDFGHLDPAMAALSRHPDVLRRARGVAIGVLPVYLGTVVVGMAIGGFL